MGGRGKGVQGHSGNGGGRGVMSTQEWQHPTRQKCLQNGSIGGWNTKMVEKVRGKKKAPTGGRGMNWDCGVGIGT